MADRDIRRKNTWDNAMFLCLLVYCCISFYSINTTYEFNYSQKGIHNAKWYLYMKCNNLRISRIFGGLTRSLGVWCTGRKKLRRFRKVITTEITNTNVLSQQHNLVTYVCWVNHGKGEVEITTGQGVYTSPNHLGHSSKWCENIIIYLHWEICSYLHNNYHLGNKNNNKSICFSLNIVYISTFFAVQLLFSQRNIKESIII